MPEVPPVELVATLERLGLATAEQVARMGRRVGRLAKDLPRFDSVWIDALAQARVVTPFQAAELNAGHGNSLRVGPYLLCERLAHPYYVACYRAKNVESGEMVRLAVVENLGTRADAIVERLKRLTEGGGRRAEGGKPIPNPQSLIPSSSSPSPPLSLSPSLITNVSCDDERIFVASPWINGRTAAEWMVHHGRLPPEVVLEIARAMLAELVELERVGTCHGDVSTASLMLTDIGDAVLTMPGLRGILRPEEGYAHDELLPEAFDSLAPERIASGTPPNTASDIYACGCVWWHLLCGRPPLPGGSSLTKLRAAQTGAINDVRRYAPDVPPPLAAAISACVEIEPSRRPESMARLAAMLGSPTRNGKGALADCLARTGRPMVHWTTTTRSIRRSPRTPLWLAGAVCCLAAIVAMLWPGWHGKSGGVVASSQWPVVSGQRENASGSHRMLPSVQPSSVAANIRKDGDENPIVPATFRQSTQSAADLVLAADKPQTTTSLDLHDGQCVRAASGHRSTLLVPATGLVVDKDNVRFENIDFVWNHASFSDRVKTEGAAIVRLLAGRAEFRGCSFRCKGMKGDRSLPISAIRWIHPAQADQQETALPSGQIRLADCLFDRVGTGVDCTTIGARGFEITNTLHLGTGSLVRLDHCPRSDEPLSLNLMQVTLRDSGPLLECLTPNAESQPGEITVSATACVFALRQSEPLVRCSHKLLPRDLRWTGEGSLVTPQTPILTCRETDGRQQTVDEASLSIAGLVRSEVGFAAESSGDPAASQILRWQAPLRSPNPPGIDANAVPKE